MENPRVKEELCGPSWTRCPCDRRARHIESRSGLNGSVIDILPTPSISVCCGDASRLSEGERVTQTFKGASNFRLPASSFQLPASNFRLPSSSFQLPSSSFQLPSSSFQLPTSGFQLPASSFQLPASNFQLPAALEALPVPPPRIQTNTSSEGTRADAGHVLVSRRTRRGTCGISSATHERPAVTNADADAAAAAGVARSGGSLRPRETCSGT
ncbi:hypothetical protein EYF80_011718 [Liparis tanakae]|uniref:Uncharacterized protein n=1 Tax=Liparis tanakae TaxID=230148 RepID=A0A4Z2IJB1_9TELE|nr:hypothetical protein EYF80_011718 [Liparis tanakae]